MFYSLLDNNINKGTCRVSNLPQFAQTKQRRTSQNWRDSISMFYRKQKLFAYMVTGRNAKPNLSSEKKQNAAISILSLTYPKTVIRDYFLWITDFQDDGQIETNIPRKWIHSSKVILSAYLKPAKRPFPRTLIQLFPSAKNRVVENFPLGKVVPIELRMQ